MVGLYLNMNEINLNYWRFYYTGEVFGHNFGDDLADYVYDMTGLVLPGWRSYDSCIDLGEVYVSQLLRKKIMERNNPKWYSMSLGHAIALAILFNGISYLRLDIATIYYIIALGMTIISILDYQIIWILRDQLENK